MPKYTVAQAGDDLSDRRLVDVGCLANLLHHFGRPIDVVAPQVKTIERRQGVGQLDGIAKRPARRVCAAGALDGLRGSI